MDNVVYPDYKAKELENLKIGQKTMRHEYSNRKIKFN